MYHNRIKRGLVSIPFWGNTLNHFIGDFPKVLMYHRFSDSGISGQEFGWQLDQISQCHTVITLSDCLRQFHAQGAWPKNVVVLTIDDGYLDFYEVAFPELRKRGLPATFFVTVNFIDQKIWLWPDRLRYSIENTKKKTLEINLFDKKTSIPIGGLENNLAAWHILGEHCLVLPDNEKWSFISSVESDLEVNLPRVPPHEFAACAWDNLKEMMEFGIEIGSHTLDHPILSHVPSDRLDDEIVLSKHTIEHRLNMTVQTFCYPNGRPEDINDTIVQVVKDAGYLGAPLGSDLNSWDPFHIPRMGVSRDRTDFLSKLKGLEFLKSRLRKITQ